MPASCSGGLERVPERLGRLLRCGQFLQAKFFGVAPVVVLAAAREARDAAAERAHAPDLHRAPGTAVGVLARDLAARERKIVAARLVVEAKVVARAFPFRAVRCDAAATGAVPGKQMREFVAERA